MGDGMLYVLPGSVAKEMKWSQRASGAWRVVSGLGRKIGGARAGDAILGAHRPAGLGRRQPPLRPQTTTNMPRDNSNTTTKARNSKYAAATGLKTGNLKKKGKF